MEPDPADEATGALEANVIQPAHAGSFVVAAEVRRETLQALQQILKQGTPPESVLGELMRELRIILYKYEPFLARVATDATLAAWLAGAQQVARAGGPLRSPVPDGSSVIYFTGSSNAKVAKVLGPRDDTGIMVTPLLPSLLNHHRAYARIAIDNGVFSKATPFDAAAFRRLAHSAAADPEIAAKVAFIVAPDVVGDAAATLARFGPWAKELRALGLPVAFVAQNGLEDMPEQIPWDDFDVLFIGGSTAWKLGEFGADWARESRWRNLFREAKARGKAVHIGRVNSWKRLELSAYGLGAASVDGTYLAYGPRTNLPKLTQWLDDFNAGSARREAAAVRTGPPPIVPPIVYTPVAGDPEPIIRFPIIDQAVRDLAARQILEPEEFYERQGAARLEGFTVSRMASLDAIEKVRDRLVEAVAEGDSLRTFRGKVEEALGASVLTPAHLETVFRTGVMSAYSRGQKAVVEHPLVESALPFVWRVEIRDSRLTELCDSLSHAGLEGTGIYCVDDPVWRELAAPPSHWNCRCGTIFLTIERAARKGLAVAKKWLETGVRPPDDELFVARPAIELPKGWVSVWAA